MPISLICERLSFGVPLEDIFPPGEIHPNLNSLFDNAYKIIVGGNYRIQDVVNLSHFQDSMEKRLELKEKLVLSRNFNLHNVLPGTLLWVIRHFIGLLPIPLLPEYANNQKYNWLDISKICKNALIHFITYGRYNQNLLNIIADELLLLPTPHFLLMARLLNFLRSLSVLYEGEPKINKHALFALVKYFASSLVIRPFRPGFVSKTDRQYYPLLMFIILKWPNIRRACMKSSDYKFFLHIKEKHPIDQKALTLVAGHAQYLSKRHFKSKSTQTEFGAHFNKSSPRLELLNSIVPSPDYDYDFVRNVSCQTEKIQNNIIKTQVVFVKQKCCYATLNRKKIKKCSNRSKVCNIIPEHLKPSPYGWNLSSLSTPKNDPFVSYENAKDFDPIAISDLDTIKEEFVKTELKATSSNIPSPIQSIRSSSISEQLTYHDLRKSLHEELKYKLNQMNETINENESDITVETNSDNGSISELSHETLENTSLISIKRIKSKLDILQIFSGGKGKERRAKKSASCEKNRCRIKYEKIRSVSSIP